MGRVQVHVTGEGRQIAAELQQPFVGDVRAGHPLLRRFGEQPQDEPLQPLGHVPPSGAQWPGRDVGVVAHRGQGRGGGELVLSGEHLVQDHAEGVEVALRAGGPAHGLLGRHVRRCAEHLARSRESRRIRGDERGGDAEVEDLHRPVGTEHQVGGLEVPVHQRVGVGHGQDRAHLSGDRHGPGDGNLGLVQKRGDGTAVDELHDQIEVVAVRSAVIDRGHSGVLQPGRDP